MSDDKPKKNAGGAEAPPKPVRAKLTEKPLPKLPNAARDIDDPRPWRVDAFYSDVRKAALRLPKSHVARLIVGDDPHRAARIAAHQLYRAYQRVIEDDTYRKYLAYSSSEFKNRLHRSLISLNSLVECGRGFIIVPRNKNQSYDEYIEEYGNEQHAEFSRIIEMRDCIKEIYENHKNYSKTKGPRHDHAMWLATAEFVGAMYIFKNLEIENSIYYKIAEAAWMDAGMPDIPEKSKKKGQTLELWLRKYLKSFN